MRAGFSLALALAVLLGALAYYNTQAMIRAGNAARHTLTVILEMDRTLAALTDAQAEQRGCLIGGGAADQAAYARAGTDLAAHLETLERLTADDPGARRDAERVRSRADATVAELDATLALRRTRGFDAARRATSLGPGGRDMGAARGALADAVAHETRAWERQQRLRAAAVRAAQWQVGLLIASEFALLLWAYGLARRDADGRARAQRAQEAQGRELEAQHEELLAQQSQLVVAAREMSAANARLEYASRRFEELYQALPVPCFCHDAEGRIFEWNRAFETCYGLTSAQVFQRPVWEAVSAPGAESALRGAIARALAGEPQDDWELTLGGPDGPARHLLCNTVPMRGPEGQVTGGISTHLDITERKRVEAALRHAEEKYRGLFENATEGIFQSTPDGRLLGANPAFARMFGFASAEQAVAQGADIARRFYADPDQRARFLAHMGADGFVSGFECEMRRADGGHFWTSMNARSRRDAAGALLHYEGTLEDITERKGVEAALRVSEARLRAFHDITAAAGGEGDDKIERLLQLGCREFGLPTGVVAQMDGGECHVRHAVSPDGALRAGFVCDSEDTLCREMAQGAGPLAVADVGGSHWRRHPAHARFGIGAYFGVPLRAAGEDWGTLCFTGAAPRAAFTASETDFLRLLAQWIGGELERRRSRQRVTDSEERFRSAIGSMNEGFMVQDADGTVLLCNEAAARILGVSADDLRGRPAARAEWRIVRDDGSDFPRAEQPTRRAFATGQAQPDVTLGVERADGRVTWLSMNAAPLFRADEAAPYATVQTFADISGRRDQEARIRDYTVVLEFQKRELEAQKQEVEVQRQKLEMQKRILERTNLSLEVANRALESLATLDGLTGLKNHRSFQDRLETEVCRSQRYDEPLSLILLDVDHFKQYNDTYGHPAGDEVLRTVGLLLEQDKRETDFAARYGGEEFVVILPNTDGAGARIVAERLRASIASAEWPCRRVTASLGASTLTPLMADRAALVATADGALYRAKGAGRNRAVHAADPVADPLPPEPSRPEAAPSAAAR